MFRLYGIFILTTFSCSRIIVKLLDSIIHLYAKIMLSAYSVAPSLFLCPRPSYDFRGSGNGFVEKIHLMKKTFAVGARMGEKFSTETI